MILWKCLTPSRRAIFRVEVKNTKFSDVIGVDEAKEEVQQYVNFLKNPRKYTQLGARLPKGCLLTGRPGTGKTLLAKAVAGEAGVPFFSCSGADFIEVFGGSGPKRVRELFAAARAEGACVVFIDEIDAMGRRSGGGRGMGNASSEENRTINQLLSELDGMQTTDRIVVLGATNFPEALDKALLREGRFDRKVNLPMPDHEARCELFAFYLKQVITGDPQSRTSPPEPPQPPSKKDDGQATTTPAATNPLPEPPPLPLRIEGIRNEDIAKELSERTPGVSPAQIATIVNEAALSAAVKGSQYVARSHFQEAVDDVLVGKKHRQRMSGSSLRRTAFHESGHCLVAWLSPLQKDVIKLSIIPRGPAGGYTQQMEHEVFSPQTNEFLFTSLCVMAGGRVAEQLILGDISTGAMDDLQRATKLAMDKLLLYGMSEAKLAPREETPKEKKDANEGEGSKKEKTNPSLPRPRNMLSFLYDSSKGEGRSWMPFSERHHAEVELEAREMVDRAFSHVEKLLKENKGLLVTLAETLLEKRELDRKEIEKVLGPRPQLETLSVLGGGGGNEAESRIQI